MDSKFVFENVLIVNRLEGGLSMNLQIFISVHRRTWSIKLILQSMKWHQSIQSVNYMYSVTTKSVKDHNHMYIFENNSQNRSTFDKCQIEGSKQEFKYLPKWSPLQREQRNHEIQSAVLPDDITYNSCTGIISGKGELVNTLNQ